MPDWLLPVLLAISKWAIRLMMPFVVIRRRRPASAMAWLLVIFFEPWVGLILYALIGRHRLPRRRMRHHALLRSRLQALRDGVGRHAGAAAPVVASRLVGESILAERLGHLPVLDGNDAEVISSTTEVIDRLVVDIDAAAHHVHLLFYIYADDATAGRVTDALGRAVKRGVKCRVLVDAVGSRALLRSGAGRIRELGVELREALPVGLFRRHIARLDLRNHRKLAVIDGRIGYSGSQNLIDASYGHKDLTFADLMVRLTGPVVLELQTVFVEDWYFETEEALKGEAVFPEPQRTGDIAAQLLPSGPNFPTGNYQRMVVASLHAARRHVVITTPYWIADEAVMQAVEVAVLRGVHVEIIVSSRSDHPLVDAASRSYYGDLLALGAKVHLYRLGNLHAKTMTIDETIAFVGSSNFDIRSFELDFEINMLFYGRQIAARLRKAQRAYLRDSDALSLRQWQQRPDARRALEGVARLFSPLF